MTDSLVQRLRDRDKYRGDSMIREAADEIDRLEAQVARQAETIRQAQDAYRQGLRDSVEPAAVIGPQPCGACGSFVLKFEDHKPGCGFGPMPPDKSSEGTA